MQNTCFMSFIGIKDIPHTTLTVSRTRPKTKFYIAGFFEQALGILHMFDKEYNERNFKSQYWGLNSGRDRHSDESLTMRLYQRRLVLLASWHTIFHRTQPYRLKSVYSAAWACGSATACSSTFHARLPHCHIASLTRPRGLFLLMVKHDVS